MYDGDSAGINAALKNRKVAFGEGTKCEKLSFFRLKMTPTHSLKITMHQMYWPISTNTRQTTSYSRSTDFLEECRRDPIKKAQLISDIANTIAVIPDLIKRSVYVKECARILETDEKIFYV